MQYVYTKYLLKVIGALSLIALSIAIWMLVLCMLKVQSDGAGLVGVLLYAWLPESPFAIMWATIAISCFRDKYMAPVLILICSPWLGIAAYGTIENMVPNAKWPHAPAKLLLCTYVILYITALIYLVVLGFENFKIKRFNKKQMQIGLIAH